jgi:hypothetical protein
LLMNREPKLIGTVETDYGTANVYLSAYCSDPDVPVVLLQSECGEPIATLSVNIEGSKPGPGEFFAKTWSENERIAAQALASGLFEDTGKRVATGWVQAQVWRFKQRSGVEPKVYLDTDGKELLISDVWGMQAFATHKRLKRGGLLRFNHDELLAKATREEAQADLDEYAATHGLQEAAGGN